jgi:hypothetical protein
MNNQMQLWPFNRQIVSQQKPQKGLQYPLYGEYVFSHTHHGICICDARELVENVETWAFNRKLNIEHVDNIYNDLKDMKIPHFMGSIKILSDSKGHFRLVDGQHRLQSIRKMLDNDIEHKWNMDILVEIYSVDDLNGQDAINFYQKANKNLNVTIEDQPEINIMSIINGICAEPLFKCCIVDKDKVNRPRISKKNLYEQFKKYYTPSSILTIEEIVDKVKHINTQISMKNNILLFGSEDNAKIIQKERAKKIKFYLNMDCDYDPSVWIPYIYNGRKI